MIRNLWLWLVQLVTHPGVTLRDMKDRVPVWPSLVIAAIVFVGGGTYLAEALLPGIRWLPAYVLIGAVVGLLVLLVFLLILHAVARLLRGRGGGIRDLLRLWGYIYLPVLLVAVPLIVVLRLAALRGSLQGHTNPVWLIGIIVTMLVTAVWSLILQIQVLKVTYRLTVLASIFVLILAEIVSDTLAWIPENTLVHVVSTKAAGLMDPMDARAARDIHMILQRVSALAPGSDIRDGSIKIPVNIRTYPPKRGDEVIFFRDEHSRRDLGRPVVAISVDLGFGGGERFHANVGVARVVGLPGETVAVRDGRVVVNGNEVDEPYVTVPGRINLPPVEVPEGSFFLLGDNRSLDPTAYGVGVVRSDKILGGLLRTWTRIFIPLSRLLVHG